jgi:hypothetical protein
MVQEDPMTNLTISIDAEDWVRRIGREIGFGRVIQIAKQAWYDHAVAEGHSEATAARMCGVVCPWCYVDSRTGKKAKAVKKRKSRRATP